MGWEQRGTRWYYYEKKRRGNRVFSEYWGSGEEAEIAAQFDATEQSLRCRARDKLKWDKHREKKIEHDLETIEAAIGDIMLAAMQKAGFHRHRGQWRKKRHKDDKVTRP